LLLVNTRSELFAECELRKSILTFSIFADVRAK